MKSKPFNQQRFATSIIYCYFFISVLSLSVSSAINLKSRHTRDLTSDTIDIGLQNGGESYDTSESSEISEISETPPNELSVIRMNDTSVVLRWELSEEAQDHTNYFMVQYKSTRKNATTWKTDPKEISSFTRAYQINGLRPGNYLFSVVAVYDNQDSAASKPLKYKLRAKSKIQPWEMPEMTAPDIYWTETDSDYFRFKWKYTPKDNDTDYFGYLIYYRSVQYVSDFLIFNTLDSNVEIAELEPNMPYESKVVAYNTVAVSEFSHTITLRTKPPKIDTPITPTAQPTIAPITTVATIRPEDVTTIAPTTQEPTEQPNNDITTPKPPSTNNENSNNVWQSIVSFFKPIISDQSDAMLTVRYLLIVLVPSLFVIFGLIFCIRPYKNKKESRPPSSTDDSQFDLEINGYFKNSFPGVEEKEYPIITNGVHTGFVNNHPHINDFA